MNRRFAVQTSPIPSKSKTGVDLYMDWEKVFTLIYLPSLATAFSNSSLLQWALIRIPFLVCSHFEKNNGFVADFAAIESRTFPEKADQLFPLSAPETAAETWFRNSLECRSDLALQTCLIPVFPNSDTYSKFQAPLKADRYPSRLKLVPQSFPSPDHLTYPACERLALPTVEVHGAIEAVSEDPMLVLTCMNSSQHRSLCRQQVKRVWRIEFWLSRVSKENIRSR